MLYHQGHRHRPLTTPSRFHFLHPHYVVSSLVLDDPLEHCEDTYRKCGPFATFKLNRNTCSTFKTVLRLCVLSLLDKLSSPSIIFCPLNLYSKFLHLYSRKKETSTFVPFNAWIAFSADSRLCSIEQQSNYSTYCIHATPLLIRVSRSRRIVTLSKTDMYVDLLSNSAKWFK